MIECNQYINIESTFQSIDLNIDSEHSYIIILSKSDLLTSKQQKQLKEKIQQKCQANISYAIINQHDIHSLLTVLKQVLPKLLSLHTIEESHLIIRQRHKSYLIEVYNLLTTFQQLFINNNQYDIVLASELLRQAKQCIGKITGKVDVEDLLDIVFKDFCIGK